MPDRQFNIGDKIEVVETHHLKGNKGTVVAVYPFSVDVRFDNIKIQGRFQHNDIKLFPKYNLLCRLNNYYE